MRAHVADKNVSPKGSATMAALLESSRSTPRNNPTSLASPPAYCLMNSALRRRDGVRACFRAALVSLIVLPLSSSAAGLRIVNSSYPGIYFGSFAGGAGGFALYVREDNTGTFLGFLPGNAIGISHST